MERLLTSLVVVSACLAGSGADHLVPALTESIGKTGTGIGGKEFVNLWQEGLKRQMKSHPEITPPPAPRTLVVPHNSAIFALVPMDAPNPLYADTTDGVVLRTGILRDYMLAEAVSPEDDKLKQEGGYKATNYNNQTITFIKNELGELKIGDFPVMEVEKTADGAFIYIFMGLLFQHKEAVKDAMHKLYQRQPQHSAFGG